MSDIVIVEKELSYTIMQVAFEVHNTLGPGFPEKIYEEAMSRELPARGIEIERQKRVVVKYKGKPLGEFFLDNIANSQEAQSILQGLKNIAAKVHEKYILLAAEEIKAGENK